MTSAVTTIAPATTQAPASTSALRAFDRAALAIFGTMLALIILLTALLVETSFPTTAATGDDAGFTATVAAQTAPSR